MSRSFLLLIAVLAVDQFVKVDDPGERGILSWLGIAAQAIPLAGLLFAPFLLGRRLARFVICPVFVWMLIHGALQLYFRSAFNMLVDGDWIGIIRASSPSEIAWFFKNFGVIGFAGIAVVLAAAWFGCRVIVGDEGVAETKATNLRPQVIGIIGLVIFLAYAPFTGGIAATIEKVAAFNFISDSVRCQRLYGQLEEMAKAPRFDTKPVLSANARDVAGVLVLGESSCRSHWSLYGYARPTAAPLDFVRNELVVFSNVTAVASETSSALRKLFVGDGHTLTQWTSAAGMRTALFSNHERWGQWGGVESYVFAGARQTYLQEENLAEPYYDDALLPYLEKELKTGRSGIAPYQTGREASFTVLHLIGSHCPPSRHYPQAGAPFAPEPLPGPFARWHLKDQLNHYDNTIWFTAKVVAEAIAMLKKRGGPAYLIFVSDHGESPSSDKWRDVASRDVWEVPAFIWFSKEYELRFPNVVRDVQEKVGKKLRNNDFLSISSIKLGAN